MRNLFSLTANSVFRMCLIFCGLLVSVLMALSLFRIQIDTNILTSLPKNDPILADARFTISNHPFQNQIVIDVSSQKKNSDALVAAGEMVEAALTDSGLFASVGMKEMQHLFPELLDHITNNLPALFSAEDLNTQVAPLLTDKNLKFKIKDNLSQLLGMDGIGQTEAIINDPLGLRIIVLQKFKQLMPAENVHFYKGHLLSSNRDHLLVLANPKSASIDSKLSREITDLIEKTRSDVNRSVEKTGDHFTLTPVGAYRAALDNETAAKKDTQNATLYASIGIALLLIFSFPRPLIGLLAFLPAIFGTVCSLAVYAMWHESISIMTIGFGAAIISITVDHGISYLLFLDRPHETKGRSVAKEVRAVGLLSVLTSVCAFLTLSLSGFPILSQIGLFAAFGLAFSFLFVHFVFPLMLPTLRPGNPKRTMPLQNLVNSLFMNNKKYKLLFAAGLFAVMGFYARPEFKVDIASMNTITQETMDAEALVSTVWGNKIFDKIYMLITAGDLSGLQNTCDGISHRLAQDLSTQKLSGAFLPSMIFPGTAKIKENQEAWKRFWHIERKTAFYNTLNETAAELGFSPEAFSDTYTAPKGDVTDPMTIPPPFREQLGIHQSPEDGSWIAFASLTPGPAYDAEAFFSKYHDAGNTHLFDPALFSKRLGEFLSHTFIKMIVIVGLSVLLLILLFFADITLTLVALSPILFSMACTLGTLHLLNLPLNFAGLMLSVVVIGMGIDYSLYLIRAYQRYRDESHPFQNHIRMTIFLAAASTLIGFGALSTGEHNLMKDIGLFLVLGIGFALMGTITLLPPMLNYLFRPATFTKTEIIPNSTTHLQRIRRLYRHLNAYPRLFARFKILFDPLFKELSLYLNQPNILIDIGCGFGVPAAWVHALYPDATIYGIEPDMERVKVASMVVNKSSRMDHGKAPDLPDFAGNADTALMLDMIHYLNDADLTSTFANLLLKLSPSGRLIMRVTVPFKEKISFYRRLEKFRLTLFAIAHYYRSLSEIEHLLTTTGFIIKIIAPSGNGREEIWIVAEANGNPV